MLSRRAVFVCGASLLAGCSGLSAPLRDHSDSSCATRTYLSEPTDWPFPAYDAANTGHAPADSAPDATTDRSVAWRQTLSSLDAVVDRLADAERAVVADGQLVVPYLGRDGRYRVSAIDTTTGEVNWTREFRTEEAPAGPFVVGENVYYATETAEGNAGLVLNAADGVTRTRIDDEMRWWYGGQRALALGNDANRVVARSPLNWGPCWNYEPPASIARVVATPGRVILAIAEDGDGSQLVSVHPASGEATRIVSLSGQHGDVITGVAVRDDRLVVTTESHLLSIDAANGERRWSADIGYVYTTGETDDGEERRAAVHPTLGAITEEAVVVLRNDAADSHSRVEVYSRAGELSWATDERGGWWQAPVVAGDTIYTFVTPSREEGAKLLTYDLATGELLDAFALEQSVYHSPIVADGHIYAVGEAVVAVD